MNKIFLFLMLLSPMGYSQIIVFNPMDAIKSSEFNNNFQYVRNLLKLKNRNIEFVDIQSQNLITKENLEIELGKLQEFGIIHPTISSTPFLKSQELNHLFSEVINGIDTLEYSAAVTQNSTKVIDLSSVNAEYPSSFTVEVQGTKGLASIVGTTLSYMPQTNVLGTDFIVIKALDGNIANKTVKINLNIDGEGIILDNTASFRTYHDGSLASTCNDYKITNSGKKKYLGSVGNGIYKISIPTIGEQLVYCDMTADAGGWTLIASGGSNCTNFIPRGATSPVYNTHASYGTNCGYFPEIVVRRLATSSTNLRLRVGASAASYTQVNSTGDKPLQSLRNATNWHTNNAHLEFSAGFQWAWSCASAANSWPNMFHACNYTNGVHWLGGHKHSHIDSGRPVISSTWLK